MKAQKLIAAMALAVTLSTTALPAYAANFTPDAGDGNTGKTTQSVTEKVEITNPDPTIEAEGDITIDGVFTKQINTLPPVTEEGHYLRVTMPITMNFTYDIDSQTMTSADNATITNKSVKATTNGTANNGFDEEEKAIKMKFISVEENKLKPGTIGSTKFVSTVDESVEQQNSGKVLLPFELKLDGIQNSNVNSYHLATLEDPTLVNQIPEILIPAGRSVNLKLQKIVGQNVGNKDLVKVSTTTTSHNLKMQFEYIK